MSLIRVQADGASSAAPTEQPAQGAQQQQAAERPAWLPEKFKTPEELAKSYSELEARLSAKPTTEQKPADGEQKPADGEQKPAEGEQKPAEADPKTDAKFQPFFDEFSKDGKLSDESYNALEKQGIPRSVVDQYIRSVQSDTAAAEARVYDAVGGKDNYTAMTKWAAENLSADEIKAYNDILETGTPAQVLLATQGLQSRHQGAVGRQARPVHGSGSANAVQPFRSTAEVTAAMSDPRYASDEAYRADVMARVAISDY